MRLLAVLVLLAVAAPSVGDVAPAYLVADINPAPVPESDSDPFEFLTFDGIGYFVADDGWHGAELWRTDGGAVGTVMVADIAPGRSSSTPGDLTVIGDALWFRAWDDTHGCGIWRSDGTADGTTRIATLHTLRSQCLPGDGTPGSFTAVGDVVFFVHRTPELGSELWRTDGTPAGTMPLVDLFPGYESGAPQALTAFDGALFFVATDGLAGFELWRSDGTAAGTQRVRDIRPGPADGIPPGLLPRGQRGRLHVVGDALLFAADDGEHGVELWRSDGSAGGTVLLVDTEPDTDVGGLRVGINETTPFVAVGDGVAFFSLHATPAPVRVYAWHSDGRAGGTERVVELPRRASPVAPSNLTAVGDAVYYTYGALAGVGLWRLDGRGVTAVATLPRPGDRVVEMAAVGDQLMFLAPTADDTCALWRSDGTPTGTVILRGLASECPEARAGIGRLGQAGGRVLVAGVEPGRGRELFGSDGTSAGSGLLLDINDTSGRTADAEIEFSGGGAIGDVLLFSAAPGEDALGALWRSDGSATGTMPILPLVPLGGGTVNGRFVFTAFDGADSTLWSTDGTAAGTSRLLSASAGAGRDVIATPTAVFFSFADAEAGGELWRSDGTAAGTRRVRDITPGQESTSIGQRLPFAGGLAFVVRRPAGDELWRTVDTAVGAERIAAFGGAANRVRELVDVDGVLYLDLGGLMPGHALWRSDGTGGGTQRIVDLAGDPDVGCVGWLAAGPAAAFFARGDATTGIEPWRSDGTSGGTGLLRDIAPGPASGLLDPDGSLIPRTGRAGDTFLFVADDGAAGPELWRSDGTPSGTEMVRDVDPRDRGVLDEFALRLTQVGSRVMYGPNAAGLGHEPWISDGTDAGTRPLADIAPGPRSSLRQGAPFAVTRTHVFMAATDGVRGRELWAIPRAAIEGAPPCAGDCDGDFHVGIAELIRGVGIALGGAPATACAPIDRDGDGGVSISELVGAVAAALDGCPLEEI